MTNLTHITVPARYAWDGQTITYQLVEPILLMPGQDVTLYADWEVLRPALEAGHDTGTIHVTVYSSAPFPDYIATNRTLFTGATQPCSLRADTGRAPTDAGEAE